MARHRSSFLIILVAIGIHLRSCWAEQTRMCTLSDRRNNLYMCGSNWAETLSMLCYPHGYAGGTSSGKRSLPDFPTDNTAFASLSQPKPASPMTSLDYTMEDQFLPKTKALAYIKGRVRRSTNWMSYGDMMVFMGPMCECCHNRCSIREMVQYCMYPEIALDMIGIGK